MTRPILHPPAATAGKKPRLPAEKSAWQTSELTAPMRQSMQLSLGGYATGPDHWETHESSSAPMIALTRTRTAFFARASQCGPRRRSIDGVLVQVAVAMFLALLCPIPQHAATARDDEIPGEPRGQVARTPAWMPPGRHVARGITCPLCWVDPSTKRPGLAYPVLASGYLHFKDGDARARWADPMRPIRVVKGDVLAEVLDYDTNADITSQKAKLSPMEQSFGLFMKLYNDPMGMVTLEEKIRREGTILRDLSKLSRQELTHATLRLLVAPADAEIIEGTRVDGNLGGAVQTAFRYYPLSHVRIRIRVPLHSWGPDRTCSLLFDDAPVRILRILSVDLDETEEAWLLEIEAAPNASLRSMGDQIRYEFRTEAPQPIAYSGGIAMHPPSTVLAGTRRSHRITPPQIAGLLAFERPENSWVRNNERIGHVTVPGLDDIVRRAAAYADTAASFHDHLVQELTSQGAMSRDAMETKDLVDMIADARKMAELPKSMELRASADGMLTGTLDYQGPVVHDQALAAHIVTPLIEIPEAVVPRDIDVRIGDVVIIALPSGAEKLASVYQIIPEAVGPHVNLRDFKRVSALAFDPEFHIGDAPDEQTENRDRVQVSAMPVELKIPSCTGPAQRDAVQRRLKAILDQQVTGPRPNRDAFPVRFTFRHCGLSPLEKLAYMARGTGAPDYPTALSRLIIREANPENRWSGYRRLLQFRPAKDFGAFVSLAREAPPDIATAAILHLKENCRPIELAGLLSSLMREGDPAAADPVCGLAYQSLRALLDYRGTTTDALAILVQQARADPDFRSMLEPVLLGIIRTEGENSPAAVRILRGDPRSEMVYWTDGELRSLVSRLMVSGESDLASLLRDEINRRAALCIRMNPRYGYAADFVERGFLFIRDLPKKDRLARIRENARQDLLFLLNAPSWRDLSSIDLEVRSLAESAGASLQIATGPDSGIVIPAFLPLSGPLPVPAFRSQNRAAQGELIERLARADAHAELVMLLGDPEISRTYGGTILDALVLSSEGRLELARFYSRARDEVVLKMIEGRHFEAALREDIAAVISPLEAAAVPDVTPPANSAEPNPGPAKISIYQNALARMINRAPDPHRRGELIVSHMGLLPSGFCLRTGSAFPELLAAGADAEQIRFAARFVAERRALQHAIRREQEKRGENIGISIDPGADEILFRDALEDVGPSMPTDTLPIALLEERLARASGLSPTILDGERRLSVDDAIRIARNRSAEFGQGHRETMTVRELAGEMMRLGLSPLFLLLAMPLVWLTNLLLFSVERMRLRSGASENYFAQGIARLERMSRGMEGMATEALRHDMREWLSMLKARPRLEMNDILETQNRLKRMMDAAPLVFHLSADGVEPRSPDAPPSAVPAKPLPDSIEPNFVVELTPVLSFLALISRLTAEKIVFDGRRESPADRLRSRRLYLMSQWFSERSAYFSGYRYTLNPLANHHLAASYVWNDIPYMEFRDEWRPIWVLVASINALVGVVNLTGRVMLSLPMRIAYLFAPISLIAQSVFSWALPRLVIEPGNRIESGLYPDPRALVARARRKLTMGRLAPSVMIDAPGGRYAVTIRRVATRILPFLVVAAAALGGFPAIYQFLTSGTLDLSSWDFRSTGFLPLLASLFTLSLALVMHWIPLLMGWIPFQHWKNTARLNLMARDAAACLLPTTSRCPPEIGSAEEALGQLNLEEALRALREERIADEPLLDLVVLMEEDSERADAVRRAVKALVNPKTLVMVYESSRAMDGGGAFLDAEEFLAQHYREMAAEMPNLPERFEQTRSAFVPIGAEANPFLELPLRAKVVIAGTETPVTPLALLFANIQAILKNSFVLEGPSGARQKVVGKITAPPERLYVGPNRLDADGDFQGGVMLVGANQSIAEATDQRSLIILGNKAFIRTSPQKLAELIQGNPDKHEWIDLDNAQKRQLPTAQLVVVRFRTPERYARHIHISIRYNQLIKAIRRHLLGEGRNGDGLSEEELVSGMDIHYMRHLIVPWFIAHKGGSLERYRSAVLTDDLRTSDRRRIFHEQVLRLVEQFQEESADESIPQERRPRLPKVRFIISPESRAVYARKERNVEQLLERPEAFFASSIVRPGGLAPRCPLPAPPANVPPHADPEDLPRRAITYASSGAVPPTPVW